MQQAETTCKLLHALGAGRWTMGRIAAHCGISTRTARRYVAVLSSFFSIQEQRIDRHVYYWLDDIGVNVRGRVPERFCSRGHDKLAPHGGYYIQYPGGVYLSCAVCRRESNNASYARNGRKKHDPGRRPSGVAGADAVPAAAAGPDDALAVR
jgi:hypothetical protein